MSCFIEWYDYIIENDAHRFDKIFSLNLHYHHTYQSNGKGRKISFDVPYTDQGKSADLEF